jgi:dihydroorotase
MKYLIQSAQIVCPGSSFHLKRKNVLLHNGKIVGIGDKNFEADKVIEAAGMVLSPGWFDLGCAGGDPGFEHKEDLVSLTRAAAAGGFTELALLPNTQPVVQTKNEISYLTRHNASRLVQVHALAAVTRNTKGEELTEMIDLHHAGAVGFTDGLKTLWHTDVFLKALLYLQKVGGVLIDHAEDTWLNLFGQMHEGVNSTMLGLKGMPRLAEEVAVQRNLELLAYTGGRLHLARISTARTVELIRNARKKGFRVTCDITAYQPLYTDNVLSHFDTNYKVNPPLREKADVEALLKGLRDGTIDVICSGHVPHDHESKQLEFDQAEAGVINLQTVGSQIAALAEHMDLPLLIEKVAVAPRQVLGLPVPDIEEGAEANLTLFAPQAAWTFTEADNLSKSANSPWLAQPLQGRAVAVFNNGKAMVADGYAQ